MAFLSASHVEGKVYPCPLSLPTEGKGLAMPSITPKTKVYHCPLSLTSLPTQGKCLALSLSLSYTQEICVIMTWPLSLLYTKKRSNHAPLSSHTQGTGLPRPSPFPYTRQGSSSALNHSQHYRTRSTNALAENRHADLWMGWMQEWMDGCVERWMGT